MGGQISRRRPESIHTIDSTPREVEKDWGLESLEISVDDGSDLTLEESFNDETIIGLYAQYNDLEVDEAFETYIDAREGDEDDLESATERLEEITSELEGIIDGVNSYDGTLRIKLRKTGSSRISVF